MKSVRSSVRLQFKNVISSNQTWLLALLLGGMLAVGGCGGESDGSSPKKPAKKGITLPAKVSFTMTNSTGRTINQIMIEGFTYNVKFTSLKGGASHTLMGLKPVDLVSNITVSWTGAKGKRRTNVTAKGKIPKGFNGKLYFEILSTDKVTYKGGTF